MSYEFENVPQGGAGVGAAKTKDPNVHIIRAEDLQTSPVRDSKGVLMLGSFVPKSGKKFISVYMTGVNQDETYETSGEVDAEQIMQKLVATHPGDELEAHEFFQNNLGVDLIVVTGSCATTRKTVFGTRCSPMRLKNNFQANKDKTGHTFTFEQIQGTRFVPGKFDGVLPVAAPTATDVTIDMTVANGLQYKVEALAITAAITIPTFDLSHGDVVTLIGSGGADPATLASGDLTGATVILVDDAGWTALENATISLEVFDAGATTYLIEKTRT
jgi:hypothetical protein